MTRIWRINADNAGFNIGIRENPFNPRNPRSILSTMDKIFMRLLLKNIVTNRPASDKMYEWHVLCYKLL